MTGIPVQDEYPDWLQLKPVQEGLDPDADLAGESKSVRRRKAVQAEAEPVVEAPVAEAPAEPEAAE